MNNIFIFQSRRRGRRSELTVLITTHSGTIITVIVMDSINVIERDTPLTLVDTWMFLGNVMIDTVIEFREKRRTRFSHCGTVHSLFDDSEKGC